MIPTLPKHVVTPLLAIRTALLLGLILFGGATWYIRNRDAVVVTAVNATSLGYVFAGLVATAVAGLVFLRSRLQTLTEPSQLMSTYLVGYAFAESAGLFGAVVWFIGGPRECYFAGLILMVLAFQILPIKRS